MKALHLTGNFEDAGGILSVIRQLQAATQGKGWTHAVFVHRQYVETRQPRLDYRFSRFVCSEMPSHAGIFWRATLALLEAKRLLAREPFDIIHAHSRCGFLVGLGLAGWLNRPVLFTNHDYARRTAMYRRAANRRNLYTVVLTPNMARHYGLEERPPRINVISACCSDRFFTEPLVRQDRAAVEPRTLRLAGVGSLLRWKKWDLLAEALRQLNPSERARIEVSVWGPVVQSDPDSPRYESELRQFIQAHGLERQILLRGSTTAVSEALRQADWLILPSTNEPCSVGLIEALALGIPALVSASGGNVDIVKTGISGCFFEPGNPADLADKLRVLLNAQAAVEAPERIRESVRFRSASSVAEKYDELYRRLVDAKRSR